MSLLWGKDTVQACVHLGLCQSPWFLFCQSAFQLGTTRRYWCLGLFLPSTSPCWISKESCQPISPVCWGPSIWPCDPLDYHPLPSISVSSVDLLSLCSTPWVSNLVACLTLSGENLVWSDVLVVAEWWVHTWGWAGLHRKEELPPWLCSGGRQSAILAVVGCGLDMLTQPYHPGD